MSKQRGRSAQAARHEAAEGLRGRVELRPISSRRTRDLIEAYHYLKSWPYVGNKLLSLGIFLSPPAQVSDEGCRDERLVGVMVWGWPGFPAKADLWGPLDKAGNPSRDGAGNPLPTSHQVICLHRMWVEDGTPGNIESHALNLALRRRGSYPSIVEELYLSIIKPPKFHDEPYRLLLAVTYTDVELHTGTTCHAAGWQRWGESESDGWGAARPKAMLLGEAAPTARRLAAAGDAAYSQRRGATKAADAGHGGARAVEEAGKERQAGQERRTFLV